MLPGCLRPSPGFDATYGVPGIYDAERVGYAAGTFTCRPIVCHLPAREPSAARRHTATSIPERFLPEVKPIGDPQED